MDQANNLGETPLLHACLKCGRDEKIKLLISMGANVNVVIRDGMTPLLAVCCREFVQSSIPLLIWKGADANAKNNDHDHPGISTRAKHVDRA